MKHAISVRLPEELVVQLDERARKDRRSRSNLVALAIEYLLRNIV